MRLTIEEINEAIADWENPEITYMGFCSYFRHRFSMTKGMVKEEFYDIATSIDEFISYNTNQFGHYFWFPEGEKKSRIEVLNIYRDRLLNKRNAK